MDFNSIQTPTNAQSAANFFRHVLTEALDGLLDQVDGVDKVDKVRQSVRQISQLYRTGLSHANSVFRSDWNDAANRCAYVFLYFMHHCYLVYLSLHQNLSEISRTLKYKHNMKMCSIGGGPGSDLVGLTKFLQDTYIFPPRLQCLVLDLFPDWKLTWDTIYQNLPDDFQVSYKRCDLVRDTRLPSDVLSFIRDVDLLTLVKSFSAVSAFFRTDPSRRELLRSILNELKQGCLVLFIDNNYPGDGFEQQFASPAGLDLLFQFRGKPNLPFGSHSNTIRNFCRILDFSPMRGCDVIVRLFLKNSPRQIGVSNLQSRIHVNDSVFQPPQLQPLRSIFQPLAFQRQPFGENVILHQRQLSQSSSFPQPIFQHQFPPGSAIQNSTPKSQPSSSSSFQHPNFQHQFPPGCTIKNSTPKSQPSSSSSFQHPNFQRQFPPGCTIQNSTPKSQPSSSSSFQHPNFQRQFPPGSTIQHPASQHHLSQSFMTRKKESILTSSSSSIDGAHRFYCYPGTAQTLLYNVAPSIHDGDDNGSYRDSDEESMTNDDEDDNDQNDDDEGGVEGGCKDSENDRSEPEYETRWFYVYGGDDDGNNQGDGDDEGDGGGDNGDSYVGHFEL